MKNWMQQLLMGGGEGLPWWETDANLVGYWTSVRSGSVAATGTWSDYSTAGNDGTLVADAYVDSGGVHLDGTGDYVDVNDSASLDVTAALTLVAWVYPTSNSGAQAVLAKYNSLNPAENQRSYVLMSNAGVLQLFCTSNGTTGT